jgi:hypothetical protein
MIVLQRLPHAKFIKGCIQRHPSLDTMHVTENCGPVMQPAEKLNAFPPQAAMESPRSNSGEQAMKSSHPVLLHQMQRMGLN